MLAGRGKAGSRAAYVPIRQQSAKSGRSEVLTNPSIAAVQSPTDQLGRSQPEDNGREPARSIVLTAKLMFLAT